MRGKQAGPGTRGEEDEERAQMKRMGFTMTMALAVVSLLVAGCGGGEEATPAPTPTPEPTATVVATVTPTLAPTATPAPTGTQPSGELAGIIGKASVIDSLKYDMIVTGASMPTTTTKVWLKQKAGKMKTETSVQGRLAIAIIDRNEGAMYNYMPAQNLAYKMDISQAPESPVTGMENLEGYDPTIIGSEVVDGKDCLVVEATYEGVKTKSWIWKEHGFPVKVVTTTPQGEMTIEYKNIDFGDIPDSEFELPAGVQIVEIPTAES
jgi:outer membrane lipoprotein-sorting protein